MQYSAMPQSVKASPKSRELRKRAAMSLASAGLILCIALSCIAQDAHSAPDPAAAQAGKSAISQKDSKQVEPAPEGDRNKQISEESTQLLAMAVALKAEVDKTNKDMLSLSVIRKAEQIEHLAHSVKEKMKQSSGSN